ncbi:MAG TPA: penicillin acylase family protein [Gemmataceae bacterium]|nr:penicillin acylase family protein [Gemmataceae bacterium]
MRLSGRDMLRRIGAGERLAAVCEAAGLSRPEFDVWWKAETVPRVPAPVGNVRAAVRRPVRIERDRWGIPAVFADNDDDLFFGFGYAMAQDRLFQLDFLRRKGTGRLAEVLGAGGAELDLVGRAPGLCSVLEMDLLARTVGIRRIAEHEWTTLPNETRRLLTAFTAGVNAVIEQTQDHPPIEFDLLDYRPEPWSPLDCLTVEGEFRWYLTGRFPVIVMPELARRVLGDGSLYRAFLEVESDAESILPPGSYPKGRVGAQPVGRAAGGPEGEGGSNNWVVSGARSHTGKPLVASDPHIAFEAVSCWYEVRLCGGSFDVAGMAYVGMPAVMFGRNARVAWGCTNNICSQRDLYQERTDPDHPGCFLHDGRWEQVREREEVIRVKDGAEVRKAIRFSRNGPIVEEVLPPAARGTGPVALKWLGAYQGGWLTALLAMDRARSAEGLREAMRPWHVPTFSVVFADVDGHIGYQAAGRVPVREVWERGYRPGWEPRHQWQGLVPFEGMPRLAGPERGWVATANNRPAPEDFAYPLSGTWGHGLRAERIHEMLRAREAFSPDDFAAMQQDTLSPRARRCLPGLLEALAGAESPRVREALTHLQGWDCRTETDRVGATLFDVFFAHWVRAVVRRRFEGETAAILADGAAGLAAALLGGGPAGWFGPGEREPAVVAALEEALGWLAGRLGPDIAAWQWGRLHTLPLRHVLSGRGDLGELLDHGGAPAPGDGVTVCNAVPGPTFEARTGAGYRLIADLRSVPPALWAVDGQSQSGHPGSPHYRDQLRDWLEGRYHLLRLGERLGETTEPMQRLVLEPGLT